MRRIVAAGALLAALGVALGAVGAHALRGTLSPEALAVWATAAQYHLVHAVAMVAVGAYGMHPAGRSRIVASAGVLFALGIVLFSGSLYGLALGGPALLGPLTPLGGVSFIAGWLALAVAALR